jgi:hypothetical protein
MTSRRRIYLLLTVALLLLVATPFGLLRYRIARSAGFYAAVAALPGHELDEFADQCDRLMRERVGTEARLEFIADTTILAQFTLAGRMPYEIFLEVSADVPKGIVGIKYFKGDWRYSALVVWDEDYMANGEGEMVRILRVSYGNFGRRILLPARKSE